MGQGYAIILLRWPNVREHYRRGCKKYKDHSRIRSQRVFSCRYFEQATGWRRLINVCRLLRRQKLNYFVRYYFAHKWAFAIVEWPGKQKERIMLERLRDWFPGSEGHLK